LKPTRSAGRLFDKALIVLILVSIAVVMADSVQAIHASHGRAFAVVEWIFTLLFTAEYIARLVCVRKPLQYATSFFGIIDLIAVLPTYLALFFPGTARPHRRAGAAPLACVPHLQARGLCG
jgi:voltage-gated potassium channel